MTERYVVTRVPDLPIQAWAVNYFYSQARYLKSEAIGNDTDELHPNKTQYSVVRGSTDENVSSVLRSALLPWLLGQYTAKVFEMGNSWVSGTPTPAAAALKFDTQRGYVVTLFVTPPLSINLPRVLKQFPFATESHLEPPIRFFTVGYLGGGIGTPRGRESGKRDAGRERGSDAERITS